MVSTEFKGVGLHDTAFRDAIREDSRQTTPSRGVTPRKKFAVEANVESRASDRFVAASPVHNAPPVCDSPVRRVRERPMSVNSGEPFWRVCQEEDSRHQEPSRETYRVSFETMRSVSFQSIWLLRFMSESAIITNKISSYCSLSICFGPFCHMCRENA